MHFNLSNYPLITKAFLFFVYYFHRVSGTCRSSKICPDLTYLADGPNGSIRICNIWTKDICKLRIQPKNRWATDPGLPPGPLGQMQPKRSAQFFGCIRKLQISWFHRLQILMDPISLSVGSVRSVRIWPGPQVPDTHIHPEKSMNDTGNQRRTMLYQLIFVEFSKNVPILENNDLIFHWQAGLSSR